MLFDEKQQNMHCNWVINVLYSWICYAHSEIVQTNMNALYGMDIM